MGTPYLTTCPNDCESVLSDSDLILPEGALRYCPSCGQLISPCSKALYLSSNQDWNTSVGTWPSENDLKRLAIRRYRTIKTIAKMLAKNYSDIHLLDIGCSSGAFVWLSNHLGIHAEGVEPAEKSAKTARERGLKVHVGFLQQIHLPENSFHAITLFEVIEHIDHPVDLLKECYRILTPGGVLVIGTGNTDSWTRQFLKNRWDFFNIHQHGGHISFFMPGSIEVLAFRTGFSVKQIKTSAVKLAEKGEVPYFFYRVLKICAELLNIPARLLKKGHQMEAFLVSNKV